MIKLNAFFFAIICIACQYQEKGTTHNQINNDTQIHLIYKDFEPGDWVFSYYDSYDQQSKLICPPNKKIDINWTNDYVLTFQTMPFEGCYPVFAGDSLIITKKNSFEHPKVEIVNSRFTDFEINFTGFLSKNNSNILEYYFRTLVPDKRVPAIGTPKDCYVRSSRLLDSCRKTGLISNKYSEWITPIFKFSYYQAAMQTKDSSFNLSQIKIFDTSFISNYYYRHFLKNYFIQTELKTTWAKTDYRKAYNFASRKYAGDIKDYILFFCLTNILETYPQQKKEYIKKFETDCNTANYKQYITKNYPLVASAIKGKDVLQKIDGQIFLLDSLVKKNKGKLIYVDFWASWCVPCRAEMPASLHLRSKLKEKAIVFIYLSIDDKVGAWQKASKEEDLNDYENNYLLLNAQSTLIAKQLNISTIPRYILIDKNGKIVNANAARPGNPELISMLNEHLDK